MRLKSFWKKNTTRNENTNFKSYSTIVKVMKFLVRFLGVKLVRVRSRITTGAPWVMLNELEHMAIRQSIGSPDQYTSSNHK